jgi:hypothetical protein
VAPRGRARRAGSGCRPSGSKIGPTGVASDTLWVRGGFPDSLLAPDETRSLRWRRDFVSRGFHSGCTDLLPTRKLVVYPGNELLHVTSDIDALPLDSLARELAE